MLSHLLSPVRQIDLSTLHAAGRFASPEGENDGGDEGGKPDDAPKPKPDDTPGRIAALVDERNAERQKAAQLQQKVDALTKQVEELKGGEAAVADLQKRLEEVQNATATRFDKLLETELANLPEDAAALVQSVPGSSEAKFDFLVANRARLVPASEKEAPKPAGASNEKKPNGAAPSGASSFARSYVESRKPKTSGFPGLTG